MVKDVAGDSARERVLSIDVKVHLRHPERDRTIEVLLLRPASAVKDVLEASAGTAVGKSVLTRPQDLGTEHDVLRFGSSCVVTNDIRGAIRR
jgi:hypothetical protein